MNPGCVAALLVLSLAGCAAEQSSDAPAQRVASAVVDLSSPEATLAGYVDSLRRGDTNGVRQRHMRGGFKVRRPVPVVSYEIKKKTIYGQKEVDEWVAVPAARIGDVEFDVLMIETENRYMISYSFRNVDGRWLMYSHAAWGAP